MESMRNPLNSAKTREIRYVRTAKSSRLIHTLEKSALDIYMTLQRLQTITELGVPMRETVRHLSDGG
jgi:hypothetical protein